MTLGPSHQREENRLKMFGTKVLRKTFQLKAEVPGKWRKKCGAS
jgi:hypothetical protein